jgi:hypothetical protein
MFFLCIFAPSSLNARKITPALPTLNIAPDARSSGMGEVGAATSPDIFSQRWNAAKYAFMQDNGGVGISYVPWLRDIAKDVHLGYLSGYYSLLQNQALGASLYFFSLGNISLYNENADYLASVKPTEFAFDVSYSRTFGPNLSGALTARYINSTMIEGSDIPYTKHKHNFAVDVAAYWQKPVRLWSKDSEVAVGVTFSNIGTKLKSDGGEEYFLPMSMRVGGRLTMSFDETNSLSLSLDINKLLVPEDYKYNDDAVPTALFRSFGNGLSSSITGNTGLEYAYNKLFFARTGFYSEASRLGGRNYLTFGAGLNYSPVTFDISYLTVVKGQDGVLSNAFKFSLVVAFKERSKYRAK